VLVQVGQAAPLGQTKLAVLRMRGDAVMADGFQAVPPWAWVLESTLSLSLPHLRWLQLDGVELGGRSVILQVAPLILWYYVLLSQVA
jgi:hypothetical protein